MSKSSEAFRTITEVAEWLGLQTHVLRFWESKFPQVKPLKRAGGRRYYRPSDMVLIGGIKTLLHDQGMTIKGTQKLLREKGVSYVADLSPPLDGEVADRLDAELAAQSKAQDAAPPTPFPTEPDQENLPGLEPLADQPPIDPAPQTTVPDPVAEQRPDPEAAPPPAQPAEPAPEAAPEPSPKAEPPQHAPEPRALGTLALLAQCDSLAPDHKAAVLALRDRLAALGAGTEA